tara:strand:- start:3629 stop:4810 length:1182 start_codon:yes stop_codon:yes gene_type:complete
MKNKKINYLSLTIFLMISIFNGCATIVYKTIPLKNIAKAKGPYFVGTQNFQILDASRKMWFTGNTKGSRKLSVKMWYPADDIASLEKAQYLNEHKLIGSAISKLFGVPEALMDRAGGVKCNSWLDAVLANGKFPIIIYSHGHQSIKIANTSQAEELASNGYIVVAMDHSYDAALTILDEDKIIYSRSKLPSNDEEALQDSMIQRVKNQLKIRTEDVSFVIDELKIMFEKDKRLSKIADFDNIGIFGHSFGGCTSIMSAYNDTRIDAVLGLDTYFLPLPEDIIKKDMDRPFVHLGQVSWGDSDNYKVMNELGKSNKREFYHFAIEGSKHNDYTDFSQFTKLTRKFGSGEISPKDIRYIMNDIMLGFFDYHLKNGSIFDYNQYQKKYESVKTYVY